MKVWAEGLDEKQSSTWMIAEATPKAEGKSPLAALDELFQTQVTIGKELTEEQQANIAKQLEGLAGKLEAEEAEKEQREQVET